MPIKASYVEEIRRTQRFPRTPTHTFQVRALPFQIQPILIAPVLPGDTMKSLQVQSRVVTDPINNPLVGWWQEYYFFYCKHRDLIAIDEEFGDAVQQMMVDANWDNTAWDDTAASAYFYHAGNTGNINWVKECLHRITQVYFRNDGESVLGPSSAWSENGIPFASVNGKNGLDSLWFKTDFVQDDVELLDISAGTAGGGDDKLMTSEVEAAMRTWELLRTQGLTTQTYEEYLQTFGIRPRKEELHEPELIRYVREWSYPSNTVDPATGVPTSAVSWAIRERADKDRRFREPGFIFGVSVTRPKVYWANQKGNLSQYLNNVYAWLPAVLQPDSYASFKEHASGAGPMGIATTGAANYVWDVKDLYVHGDQFVNFDVDADVGGTVENGASVDLPDADLQRRYPTAVDIKKLFVDHVGTDPDDVAVNVKQDGVVSLTILSTLEDTSPNT